MDHDSPCQRINNPDIVNVEIPHTSGIASSHEFTPPSGHIVGMQDSNTATITRAYGGARLKPVMDRTSMMWVSRSDSAIHSPSAPKYGPMHALSL